MQHWRDAPRNPVAMHQGCLRLIRSDLFAPERSLCPRPVLSPTQLTRNVFMVLESARKKSHTLAGGSPPSTTTGRAPTNHCRRRQG